MVNTNNFENMQDGFDYITEALDSIRAQTAQSSGNTNKALSTISDHLETLVNDENKDLMKVFLSELRRSLEERHNFVSSKFEVIENGFRNLLQQSEKQLQADEVKEVFKIIATNLNTFSKDFAVQKDSISEIGLQIQQLQEDDSQKKDILRNISVLKMELEKFNNGFESIVYNLNDNFREVTQSLSKLDANDEALGTLKKDIENVYLSSNAIMSALQVIDHKNRELEEVIKHVVTKDDFNIEKEQVAKLISQNIQITSYISSLPTTNQFESLNEKIDTSVGIINALKNILSETSKQSQQLLSAQLSNLESKITNISTEEEFIGFRKELFEFTQEMTQSTNLMRSDLVNTNSELKSLLTFFNSMNIKESFDSFSNLTKMLEGNLKKSIATIAENISDKLGQTKNLTKNDIENSALEVTKKIGSVKTELTDDSKFNLTTILDHLQSVINNIFTAKQDLHIENVENIKLIEDHLQTLQNDLANTNGFLSETASQNFKNLSSIIGDLSKEIGAHKNSLSEDLQLKVSGIKNIIGDLSKEIESNGSTLSEDLQNKFSNLKASILEMPAIIQENQRVFENENKLWLEENSKTISLVGDKIQSLIQGFVAQETPFKDGILNEVGELKANLELIREDLSRSNDSLCGDISAQISALIKNIDSTLNQYDSTFNSALSGFQDTIVDYSKAIQGNVQRSEFKLDNFLVITTDIKEEVKSVFEGLSEIKNDSQISDLASNLEVRFAEVLSSISEIEETSVKHGKDSIQNVATSLVENFSAISNELKAHQNFMSVETREFVKDLSNKVESIQSQINLSGADVVSSMVEKTEGIIYSAKANLVDTIKESFQAVSSNVLEKMEASEEKSTNSIQALFLEIRETFYEKIDRSLNEMSENKRTFSDFAQEIKDSIAELNQTYRDLNSNSTSEISSLLLSVQDRISQVDSKVGNINVEDILYQVKDKISELDVSRLVEESKNEINSTLTYRFEAIDHKLDLLNVDSDTEAEENIKDIQRMVQSQNNFISRLDKLPDAEIIKDEISFIKNEVQRNLSDFDEKLSGLFVEGAKEDAVVQNIQEKLASLRGELLVDNLNLFNQISFTEESNAIKEAINEQSENLSNNIRGFVYEQSGNIKADVRSFINENTENVANNIKEFINEQNDNNKSDVKNFMYETAKDIKENIQNDVQASLSSNFNNVLANIELLQEKTISCFNDVIKERPEYVENLSEELKESVRNNLRNSLGTNFEDILASLDTLHEETTIHIKELIQKKSDEAQQYSKETKDYIKSFVSQATENSQDYIENFVNEKTQETKTYSEELKEYIENFANQKTEDAKNYAEELKSYLQDFVNEKAHQSNAYSEQIQESIQNFVNRNSQETKSYSEEAKDYIQNFFIQKAEETNAIVQELIEEKTEKIKNNLKSSLNDNFDEILASLEVLNEKTTDYIKDFVNEKSDATKLYSEETKAYIKNFMDAKTDETKEELKENLRESLSSNFNHILSNLNTLHEKTDKVDASYESLIEEFHEVRGRVFSVAEGVKNIEEDTEVIEKLQNLEFDVEKVRVLLQDFIEEKIEESKGNVKDFVQNSLDDKFNNILSNLNTFNIKTISDIKGFIDEKSEETKISSNENKEEIKRSIQESLDSNLANILTNFNSLHERTENVDENYANLIIKIQELKNKISTITGEIDNTETNAEIFSAFRAIEAKVEEAKENIQSSLEHNFSDAMADLQTLQANTQNVDSNHLSLIDELQEVKYKISAAVDEIKIVGDNTEVSDAIQGVDSNIEELKIVLKDFINEKSEDVKENLHTSLGDKLNNVISNLYTLQVNAENLSSSNSTLTEEVEDLKSKISLAISEVKSVSDNTDVYDVLQGVESDVEEVKTVLKEFIEEKSEGNKDEIKDFISEKSEEAKENIEILLGDKFSNLVSDLQSLQANTEVSGAIEGIESNVQEIKTVLKDFIEEKTEDNKDEIKDLISEKTGELQENIQTLLNNKLSIVESNLDILQANTEKADSNCSNLAEEIQDVSKKLLSAIEDVKTVGDSAESSDVLKGIESEVEEVKTILKGFVEETSAENKGEIKDLVAETLEGNQELIKEFIKDNSEASDEIIKNFIEENSSSNKTALKDFIDEKLDENNGEVKDLIAETLDGNQELLKVFIKDNSEASDEIIKDFIQENSISNKTVLKDFIDEKLEENKGEIKGLITESLEGNQEAVKEFIKENSDASGELLKSFIEETSEKSNDSLQTLLDEKFSTIGSNLEALKTNTEKVDSNHSSLVEEIQDVSGKLLSAIEEVKAEGDIGGFANSLKGVESEIEELKIVLEDFIADNADGGTDELKSFIEENSDETRESIQLLVNEKLDSILSGLNSLSESSTTEIKDLMEENDEHSKISLDEIKTSVAELKETYVDLSLNSAMEMSGLLVSMQEKIAEIEVKIDNFDFRELFETSKDELTGILADKFEIIEQKLDLLNVESDSETEENIKDIQQMVKAQSDLIEKLKDFSGTETITEEITLIKEEIQRNLTSFEEKLDSVGVSAGVEKSDETGAPLSIKEDLQTLKEELLADVLSVFGQINFITETEDIKDFVCEKSEETSEYVRKSIQSSLDANFKDILSSINELNEKTDSVDDKYSSLLDELQEVKNKFSSAKEKINGTASDGDVEDYSTLINEIQDINNKISSVKDEIKEIGKNGGDVEYSYTLQDVETDIAKLRLILNDISESKPVGEGEPIGDFGKLNEAITSISTRTNKILLTSDESNSALKSNLDALRNVVYQFEEKVKFLDNKDSISRIENKLEEVNNLTLSNVKSNKIFNQTFMYLAEWVDSASENFASIIEKTNEVENIKSSLVDLNKTMPKKADIEFVLDSISEQFEIQQDKISSLENKIDRLIKRDKAKELDIDEIVEAIVLKMKTSESKPDARLAKKVDNIDKQLAKLAKGIEKLSSYVEE